MLECQTTIDQLPQLKSWPGDGGAYVTLPQVYTEDPRQPGACCDRTSACIACSSAATGYERNREVGLHYQIHRGIGVHHAAALELKKPLRVNVFVGGPPAMALAAVMPLPEGLSELAFAGALGGRRVPMVTVGEKLPIHAEADFCISGYIDPGRQLPEGPFGDHLGYYSLAHDFPVMIVERVYHRKDAIWPFTVVGRPPQEDSMFGALIHELVEPVMPGTVAGVRAVHAVEAAGVHPLLLAIGSERYVPYEGRQRPRELLTQSNALLGQGQLSLAKYLLIIAGRRQSGPGYPQRARLLPPRAGAGRLAAGPALPDLHHDRHAGLQRRRAEPGVEGRGGRGRPCAADPARGHRQPAHLARRASVSAGRWSSCRDPGRGRAGMEGGSGERGAGVDRAVDRFCQAMNRHDAINNFPLVVVVDHSDFAARNLDNFLWTTFTRSNPATDIYGIEAFIRDKHWGCFGSLVIDARSKPHHAPPLIEDVEISRRVDALAAPGGPLHGII